MPRITKAIFPVAGLGTRILPATKVLPKEMMPVFDRPLIQHALEEAHAAGITEAIFVIGRGKTMLAEHFDHQPELESALEAKGKDELLAQVRGALPSGMQISTVRQGKALGLGHAVWCARHAIGDEPFAVLLPDDHIRARRPVLSQLVDAWEHVKGHVAAVENVAREQVNKYGVLDVDSADDALVKAHGIVEKPDPAVAPSTLAVIGRYILDPVVFTALDRHLRGAGGEIQLTDAIAHTLDDVGLHGYRFQGTRFDCGTRTGWLDANLAWGLDDQEAAPVLRRRVDSTTPAL